jgi:hypothetical protein
VNRNHEIPAPQRKREGSPFSNNHQRQNQEQSHNAPGMKCRGLRSMTMNLRCQPVVDVTLIHGFAAPSPGGRMGQSSSVRPRDLLTIVLQLQPRYRYCVQNGGGACNEVRFARMESLRTKGACKPVSDARTCDFKTIANLLQLDVLERAGESSPRKAIYARKQRDAIRRAAGMSRPVRSPGSTRSEKSNAPGASRPPLASASKNSLLARGSSMLPVPPACSFCGSQTSRLIRGVAR